ncbi:MAG TPA: TIGR03621 family F420-dependent LLM class oxidoreductase, partial [Halioglobus sp.]
MTKLHRPFRFGVSVGELMTRETLIETARAVEDLGYSVFGCTDHINAQLAPMVTLATVAAVTKTIELQPLVLANDFRHPALLAREAATLDLLSGGRFSLGVGAGWLGSDFQTTGITFHPPRVRIQRLAETIAIFKGLQTGEPFDFDGDHFRITAMGPEPRPIRSPIPLMVAGSGRVLLSLAARTADMVALNPGLPMSAGRWQTGPSPYADITDTKLAWIRSAAGGRFDQLDIQASVFAGGITSRDRLQKLAPVASL